MQTCKRGTYKCEYGLFKEEYAWKKIQEHGRLEHKALRKEQLVFCRRL